MSRYVGSIFLTMSISAVCYILSAMYLFMSVVILFVFIKVINFRTGQFFFIVLRKFSTAMTKTYVEPQFQLVRTDQSNNVFFAASGGSSPAPKATLSNIGNW